MVTSNLHGVVAGDIVESSELSEQSRRELPDLLRDTYQEVQGIREEALPYDIAISSGDEWRIYIEPHEWALVASLLFWSKLRIQGVESRMVLSVGTVDFLAEGNLNEADGAAFRSAGRHLATKMEEHDRFELLFAGVDTEDTALLTCRDLFTELVELLLTQWTEAQTRAVGEMLHGYLQNKRNTHEYIAQNWKPEPVSRQTVSEHLKRAEWYRLERTLHYYHLLATSESLSQ